MVFSDINKISENHFILLQTQYAHTRLQLLNTLISSNKYATEITLLCCDSPAQELKQECTHLQLDVDKISFVDCTPLRFDLKSQQESIEQILKSSLSTYENAKSDLKKVILIFDSLSSLIYEYDFEWICSLLRLVSNKQKSKPILQTVLILYNDMLPASVKTIQFFKHLSKAWLFVNEETLSTTLKKSSGKLLTQTYNYQISENGSISYQWCTNKSSNPKLTPILAVDKNTKEDNMSCTFKLGLTEREKEARAAVKLPYLRDSNEENESVEKGSIQYIPDEFDDWDEEDPDNDLEFV